MGTAERLDDAKGTIGHALEAIGRAQHDRDKAEIDEAIGWLEAAIAELRVLRKAGWRT